MKKIAKNDSNLVYVFGKSTSGKKIKKFCKKDLQGFGFSL
jgi:hypothetical protein